MTVMTVSTDTTAFRFGTQSLKVTTGDTGSNALYPSGDQAVVPGASYTFSCYIRTTGALTGGSVRLDICAGGTITPALFSSGLVSDSSLFADVVGGWTRLSVTFVPAGGTLLVRPVLKYTGTTLGQIFWVDGIKFEPGTLASTWAQNIVSKQLVLDQGAVQVDGAAGGLLRLRGSAGGTRDSISLGANGFKFGGDTEIASPSIGELKLLPTAAQDKTLTIETASAKLALLKMLVTGDSTERLLLRGDATMAGLALGPGNAAKDIWFYRSAAKGLTIAADFAGGNLTEIAIDAVKTTLPATGYIAGGIGPIRRVYTSGSNTWNTPVGIHHIEVECVGGGGAGGGVPATSASQSSGAGGGGAGGYTRKVILAAALTQASYTAAVGAAGTAASNATGGNGGNSTFSGTGLTTVQGSGGAGGVVGPADGTTRSLVAGGVGGTGSGGDFTVPGGDGMVGIRYTAGQVISGSGGGGIYGGASQTPTASGDGTAGSVYGGGGSGAYNSGSQVARSGGAGSLGIIIVTEYYAP